MRSVAAQEIKRRGISIIDNIIKEGPVHIIKNNHPQYVVLTEERFQELSEAESEAFLARVKESLEDLKAGKTTTFKDADSLLKAIEEDE
ncbi:MAG: prevent-host-death protein [Proteobacteria bacterium]|nr:prevent-host-death protein [Pseudomonadota bacterium]MBU1714843.1 prevent-host-death protein [Pseudomonadota bacterium]